MAPREAKILEAVATLRPSAPPQVRKELFALLREFYRQHEGKVSATLAQTVAGKLGISLEAFYLTLNHADVATKKVLESGEFSDAAQRMYKTISRKKKMRHNELLRLFGKTVGGAKGLTVAMETLIQHYLVRRLELAPPGLEHTKKRAIWYELVEVGK